MSVGQKHAERIAILARLHFGAEEIERLTEELNHILQTCRGSQEFRGWSGSGS